MEGMDLQSPSNTPRESRDERLPLLLHQVNSQAKGGKTLIGGSVPYLQF